eukprot:30408_1
MIFPKQICFAIIFLVLNAISQEIGVSSPNHSTPLPIFPSLCCKCTAASHESGCSRDRICETEICDDASACCIDWDELCASFARSICSSLPALSFKPTQEPTAFPTFIDSTFLPTFEPTAELESLLPTWEPTWIDSSTSFFPTSEPIFLYTTYSSTDDRITEQPSPELVPTWEPIFIETSFFPTSEPTLSTTHIDRIPTIEPERPTPDPTFLFTGYSSTYDLNTAHPSPKLVPTWDPLPFIDTTRVPTVQRTTHPLTTDDTTYDVVPTAFPTWDPTSFPTGIDHQSSTTRTPTAEPSAIHYPTQEPTDIAESPCCQCTHELDSYGCVDDEVCEDIVCERDGYCCRVRWDPICAMEANSVCQNREFPKCCACTENTKYSSKFPGCWEDKDCERHVCSYDPFCCGYDHRGIGYWDEMCRRQASS